MASHLHRIETSVPDPCYEQEWTAELMTKHVGGRRGVGRIIRSIYRNSGIETRHSVIDDWSEGAEPLFFRGDELLPTPGTEARNALYTREARIHFERLARQLLDGSPGIGPEDVTHLVTISCTGFYAPGPGYQVVRALGLPESVERYHIGFMGCFAAFQGLRMADAFCRADPDAVVLVLSVELCTLHLRFTPETDDLIAGAVFADGGAGALVTGHPPAGRGLELGAFHTALAPEGEEDMAWTIGNEGFRMKLSSYVPEILEGALEPALERLLDRAGLDAGEVPWWAVHPGGRQILDRVSDQMSLRPEQLAASREVLRRYGNMSSATVLFVLAELLKGELVPGDPVLAMAFGPGLTIEAGVLTVTG
jgi:predicted naringenin-chalcone synthase